jgi:proliferating cell nuclear antigen
MPKAAAPVSASYDVSRADVHVRFDDGSTLRKLCEALKDLAPQVTLDFASDDDDGEGEGGGGTAVVSVQATDTSHVCLVSLNLRVAGTVRRPTSVGLDLPMLHRVLKFMGPDDTVELVAGEDGHVGGKLLVQLTSPSVKRQSHFEIGLIDLECDRLSVPESAPDATVTMSSTEYARIFKDLSAVGSEVSLECKSNNDDDDDDDDENKGPTFRLSVHGSLGHASITYQDDEGSDMRISVSNNVLLSFSLRYLTSFTKACALAPLVTINMLHDHPVAVEFNIKGRGGDGTLAFFLAPRIGDASDDDNDGQHQNADDDDA